MGARLWAWIPALAVGLWADSALADAWVVRPELVRAHEEALAGPAMRGRGSATPDEAKAADYVAGRYAAFGLKPAPGMADFFQRAQVVRLGGIPAPVLSVGGSPVAGTILLASGGSEISGRLVVAGAGEPPELGSGDVLLISAEGQDRNTAIAAADRAGVRLVITPETGATRAWLARHGGAPRLSARLIEQAETPALVTIPQSAVATLATKAGAEVRLTLPGLTQTTAPTTNAIGYLPGTDPTAGVLVFSAHLDHLGMRPDGTLMPGANDDASGVTAVLEIAHALAAGPAPRRGILFVCYGSEEIGELGSTWFAAHAPVPVARIAANIEFEMIGAQDPKLPAGTMMMTGFDRSNLGAALRDHGALVTGDPYPEQHFFERSDNYRLALAGVVAHTISGWAVVPTYHQPTDAIANLDLPFMTRAIQSLIEPARWLATSDFVPAWTPGGAPRG